MFGYSYWGEGDCALLRLRFVRVGVTTAAALLQCQCDCWWGGWLLAVGGWLLAVGC